MAETEAYDFLQGETSVYDRVQQDDYIRRNQKPKVPPTPTVVLGTFVMNDGTTAGSATVSWTPTRKDMDYIIRWKMTGDSGYTYERSKTSPHIVRPIETGKTIFIGLAQERRQNGTRSQFTDEFSGAIPGDTDVPGDPSALACSTNSVTGTISLSWTATPPADFAYFSVLRDTASPATTEINRALSNTYEDINATPGTTYFYRIRTVDRSGNTSGFSNEVNCTVRFLGTITVTPAATCITDPTTSFVTAITQAATIPAGGQRMQASVLVVSSAIVGGAGSVQIRFSVGSAGTDVSQTETLNFTAAAQSRTAVLTSAADLSVSGTQNILYEWLDAEGDTSSFQLTSPGSIRFITA